MKNYIHIRTTITHIINQRICIWNCSTRTWIELKYAISPCVTERFRVQYIVVLHDTTGNFYIIIAWNITIYLFSDLVVQYITIYYIVLYCIRSCYIISYYMYYIRLYYIILYHIWYYNEKIYKNLNMIKHIPIMRSYFSIKKDILITQISCTINICYLCKFAAAHGLLCNLFSV